MFVSNSMSSLLFVLRIHISVVQSTASSGFQTFADFSNLPWTGEQLTASHERYTVDVSTEGWTNVRLVGLYIGLDSTPPINHPDATCVLRYTVNYPSGPWFELIRATGVTVEPTDQSDTISKDLFGADNIQRLSFEGELIHNIHVQGTGTMQVACTLGGQLEGIATASPTPQQTSAPTKQTSAPTKQTLAPTKQTSAPTKQTSAPTKQTAAPTKQTSAPSKQTAVPTKQTLPPTKQTLPPTKQTAAPTKQTLPPTKQTSAPSKQTAAPTNVCESIICEISCDDDPSCAWDEQNDLCIPFLCESITKQVPCDEEPFCEWAEQNDVCIPFLCESITEEVPCDEEPFCKWDEQNDICIPFLCESISDSTLCIAEPHCDWNTLNNFCENKLSENYGTSPGTIWTQVQDLNWIGAMLLLLTFCFCCCIGIMLLLNMFSFFRNTYSSIVNQVLANRRVNLSQAEVNQTLGALSRNDISSEMMFQAQRKP